MANELYTITWDDTNFKDYTIHPLPILWEGKKEYEMVYLSDFLQSLPKGCVFLKGVTGCGATSLALNDTSNCIIALPTRNTVHSKWVIRHPVTRKIIGHDNDIFPIYGGFHDTKDELIDYLNSRAGRPAKIVCTYDQVERLVMRMIGKIEDGKGGYVQDEAQNALCINIGKYRLYVDEIHQVLFDYNTEGRTENIMGLLRTIPLFPNVTCITATPLERRYFFDEISKLDVVTVDYKGFFKASNKEADFENKVDLVPCKYLANAVRNVVISHLEGKAFGNAHIFVNDVSFISEQILKPLMEKYADFNVFREDIRVVCGDYETNKTKVKKAVSALFSSREVLENAHKLNMAEEVDNAIIEQMKDYANYGEFVSSINSPAKKINFYTKTAWLGADVFDKTGQIYIVSDDAKEHTLVDISTSYIQILGRIRDSQNRRAKHLHRQGEHRYLSEEGRASAYEEDMQNREKNRKDLQRWFSENKELALMIGGKKMKTECYLRYDKETESLVYDKYIQYADEIAYQTIKGDYSSIPNITKAMAQKNIKVAIQEDESEAEKLKRNSSARTTFQKMFEEYAQIRKGGYVSMFSDVGAMCATLEAKEPYLRDAYDLLGEDMVRALGYKRREIAKEVEMRRTADLSTKITSLLNLRIKVGEAYTKAEIDTILGAIEQKLHLKRKLKITDYYDTESVVVRVGDKTQRMKKIKRHLSKKEKT